MDVLPVPLVLCLSVDENKLNEWNGMSSAVVKENIWGDEVVLGEFVPSNLPNFDFHSLTEKNFNDLYIAISLLSHLSDHKLFQSDIYAFNEWNTMNLNTDLF